MTRKVLDVVIAEELASFDAALAAGTDQLQTGA
jgi:hypothetical protein